MSDTRYLRVAALVFGLPCLGCNGRPAPSLPAAGATAVPAQPAAVTVVCPERRSLRRVVEQPGTVQAFEETQLFAKLPGFVRTLHADIGQRVRGPKTDSSGRGVEPGQVLAELAIPEMEEEARQKQAVVRQTEAEVEQARKSQAAAEAGVAAARALVVEAKAGVSRTQALHDRWASEMTRVTGLVQGGVIDAQTRDETQNQLRAADAARDEAKARVATSEAAVRKTEADRDKAAADVTAATARSDVAKADARRLEALLQYTTIRAPYDGVVTRRRVSTGDFLHPGAGREGIFTVARLDPVRVVVEVPEADSALVREKATVRLTIPALGGPELPAAVARTSWALEPGARTLRTEIDLPNPDGRLRAGMFVSARLDTQLPEAWTLPAAAVTRQGDTTVCFVIADGKAVRTPVQVGRSDGQFVEVRGRLRPPPGGVEPFTGNEQIAARAANLTDGQPIQVAP